MVEGTNPPTWEVCTNQGHAAELRASRGDWRTHPGLSLRDPLFPGGPLGREQDGDKTVGPRKEGQPCPPKAQGRWLLPPPAERLLLIRLAVT